MIMVQQTSNAGHYFGRCPLLSFHNMTDLFTIRFPCRTALNSITGPLTETDTPYWTAQNHLCINLKVERAPIDEILCFKKVKGSRHVQNNSHIY